MRWEPYASYNAVDSDLLDRLPHHWGIKRLKFATGNVIEKVPPSEDVAYVGLEQIQSGTGRYLEPENPVMPEGDSNTFQRGDVLFGKLRPYLAKAWKCTFSGICSSEFLTLRPRDLRQGLLAYLVLSDGFLKAVDGSTYGAKMPRASWDFIGSLRIPIPPQEDQVLMEAFLDRETTKIDTLIAEQRTLIEWLLEKRQCIISHATRLGVNPLVEVQDSRLEWVGEIPASWRIQELRRIAKPGTSITYGIVQAGPEFEGGVPYIRTSDMNGEELPLGGYPRTSPGIDEAYARSRVEVGDIVVAIRATVGKALLVPEELAGANLTQGTAKVSPGPSILGRFLKYALDSTHAQQRFEALAKGATFREITLDMLRRFPIPVPPIEEQASVVEFLDRKVGALKALIAEAETSIALLQEHRSALITAVVTGKVDVREPAL